MSSSTPAPAATSATLCETSPGSTLKDQLDLERHGGRTPAGIFTRVAQRLLALAACIWHNWRTGADDKRSLIADDH